MNNRHFISRNYEWISDIPQDINTQDLQLLADLEHTFVYQEHKDSGFLKMILDDRAQELYRGVSDYNKLEKQQGLSGFAAEEEADEEDAYLYFDPSNTFTKSELIIEGNQNYLAELKKFKKEKKVESQNIDLLSKFY